MHGCGSHAYLNSMPNIWSAFSEFAEHVPELTELPREKPNRVVAMFLSGPYLHWLGPFRSFLEPNLEIMREWISNGHYALAGHLLELQIELQRRLKGEIARAAPFLEEEDFTLICDELGAASHATLRSGRLIDSIADLACLRAVILGSRRWDVDCRRRMDELLTEPELLDRFIWYCFGEGEPGTRYVMPLTANHKALHARVKERLAEHSGLMPEQIQAAYARAEMPLMILASM
jgi:hypothetical protein